MDAEIEDGYETTLEVPQLGCPMSPLEFEQDIHPPITLGDELDNPNLELFPPLSGMTYPLTTPRSGDTAPGASPVLVNVQW